MTQRGVYIIALLTTLLTCFNFSVNCYVLIRDSFPLAVIVLHGISITMVFSCVLIIKKSKKRPWQMKTIAFMVGGILLLNVVAILTVVGLLNYSGKPILILNDQSKRDSMSRNF